MTWDMGVQVLPGQSAPPPADTGDNDAYFRYHMEPAEWVSDFLYKVLEREAPDPAMVHIRSMDDTAHGFGPESMPALCHGQRGPMARRCHTVHMYRDPKCAYGFALYCASGVYVCGLCARELIAGRDRIP